MNDVEIILGTLAAVAALAWAAQRLRVPYPAFLVIGGAVLAMIPGLPRVQLRPELVFVLFLPPLLYQPALLTSWRDFRANLRSISFLAVGLVIFTTCLVAVIAHALIDGMTWPAAFALGAIVSPPDAVAASAVLQRMRIPRRVITILEGESLLNDASAIVAYRMAVAAAAAAGTFSLGSASLRFLAVAVGGVVVGYLVARLVVWVRPRLRDPAVESAVSLLTPYFAYLPAEASHVSGVLAAVTAGIYVGRQVPLITTPQQRLRLYGLWETLVFLLNGIIFILIGLQLPEVLDRLFLLKHSMATLIGYCALVTASVVIIRLAWVFPAAYLHRVLRRPDGQPDVPWQHVFLIGWVGLRGIVSLAAALALPNEFPQRDLIILIAFSVILATLVVQGLTLGRVATALNLSEGDEEASEESIARRETTHAALSRLMALSFDERISSDLIGRVQLEYQQRLSVLSRRDESLAESLTVACRTTDDVRVEALHAERDMLVRLRDEGLISDEVLRKVQQEIDLEETQLRRS